MSEPTTAAGRAITQWAEIGDGSITRLVVECEAQARAEARQQDDSALQDAALLDRWSFKRGTLRERLEWARVQHALSVDDDSVPPPRTLEAHREWHRLCAVWYAEMVSDLDTPGHAYTPGHFRDHLRSVAHRDNRGWWR